MGRFKTRKQKRIFLVNRDFQMRYTKSAVGVGLVSTALTSLIILYPLYQFEILRIPKFLPLPVLSAMVVAAVVNIGVVAFMGIMVTHKIAGPMYSLVRCFRRVAIGKYDNLMRQREGDELRFIVRNFNDMLQSLQYSTAEDLGLLADAQKKVKEGFAETTLPELEEIEKRLRRRLGKPDV